MTQIGYSPVLLPWPTGNLSPMERLQILTEGFTAVHSTADVLLSLVVGAGPQATLPDGSFPGALELSSGGQGVAISVDTAGAWAGGDGLLRATISVAGVSTAGQTVSVPGAFVTLTSLGNQVVLRFGTRGAPAQVQAVYRPTLLLTSTQGATRPCQLPPVICRT